MAATGPQHIDAKDLLPGDIIFFMNSFGQPEHVAIYSLFKDNTHFISHAVSEPYNSMMMTRLKNTDYPYQVFRCTDFNLASRASKRMFYWVNNGLPFSHQKHDDIYANFIDARGHCHPKNGGTAQCETAAGKFADNFYRYVGMASHPGFPYKINEDSNYSEGVYCSEAVTLAFNIEEILNIDAVYSVKDLSVEWVSDKTSSAAEVERFNPSARYKQYYAGANSRFQYAEFGQIKSNELSDGAYPCSLAAWRFDRYGEIEKFVDEYKFHLPLDSTIASPWAVMAWMTQNPHLWQNLGEMVVPKIAYPLEKLESMKEAWRQYTIGLFAKREDNKSKFTLSRSVDGASPLTDDSLVSALSGLTLTRSKSSDDIRSVLAESDEETQRSDIERVAEEVISRRVAIFATPHKPTSKPINIPGASGASPTSSSSRRRLRF
tara:strand:- start:49889 stop:51187 length:1299 start_codon:yes stop_codon:yes gene_type:complete